MATVYETHVHGSNHWFIFYNMQWNNVHNLPFWKRVCGEKHCLEPRNLHSEAPNFPFRPYICKAGLLTPVNNGPLEPNVGKFKCVEKNTERWQILHSCRNHSISGIHDMQRFPWSGIRNSVPQLEPVSIQKSILMKDVSIKIGKFAMWG